MAIDVHAAGVGCQAILHTSEPEEVAGGVVAQPVELSAKDAEPPTRTAPVVLGEATHLQAGRPCHVLRNAQRPVPLDHTRRHGQRYQEVEGAAEVAQFPFQRRPFLHAGGVGMHEEQALTVPRQEAQHRIGRDLPGGIAQRRVHLGSEAAPLAVVGDRLGLEERRNPLTQQGCRLVPVRSQDIGRAWLLHALQSFFDSHDKEPLLHCCRNLRVKTGFATLYAALSAWFSGAPPTPCFSTLAATAVLAPAPTRPEASYPPADPDASAACRALCRATGGS